MNRVEYYRGSKGCKYGIWSNATKKFVFGIKEDTPMLAEARLFQKIGDDARKWKFQVNAKKQIARTNAAQRWRRKRHMTKQDLEQIYYLEREARMWERELQALRGKPLISSPLPSTGAASGGHSDKIADRAERIMLIEERVAAKRAEVQAARDAAVAFVMTIPDSLTRQIVYYRCVSLMSWRRVAYEVGGRNTEESVKKMYQRFVAKL